MKCKKHLFTTTFALAAASAAQAATISAFTFATNLSPTTQATNTTTTAIAGNGTSPFSSGRSASFSGSYFTRGAADTFTNYSQFTLTPSSGYTIDLTGLAFDFAVEAPLPLGSKTSSLQLEYSLNGGSSFTVAPTPTVAGTATTVTNVPSRNTTPSIDSTATYDLSSLGLVGETNGIIFRMYVSGSVAGDTTIIQRYDNFNVTGAVVVVP